MFLQAIFFKRKEDSEWERGFYIGRYEEDFLGKSTCLDSNYQPLPRDEDGYQVVDMCKDINSNITVSLTAPVDEAEIKVVPFKEWLLSPSGIKALNDGFGELKFKITLESKGSTCVISVQDNPIKSIPYEYSEKLSELYASFVEDILKGSGINDAMASHYNSPISVSALKSIQNEFNCLIKDYETKEGIEINKKFLRDFKNYL